MLLMVVMGRLWPECYRDDSVQNLSVSLSAGDFLLQWSFHRRPLGMDDAVVDGVPDVAGGSNHVIAEGGFLFRPSAQESLARRLVARLRLELEAQAAGGSEGVPQH